MLTVFKTSVPSGQCLIPVLFSLDAILAHYKVSTSIKFARLLYIIYAPG